MKEIKVRVECNYPDTITDEHTVVDNTEFIEVDDFNNLYEVLNEKQEEGILNHVHLEFYYRGNNICYSVGHVMVPFKDKVPVSIHL
jgi:hypothetical protein